MMLPSYALSAQGSQVHVACWPTGSNDILARAFASQGSCYVLSVGGLLREQDIPDRYREIFPTPPAEGGYSIVAPGGAIFASSTKNEETIATVEAKASRVLSEKSLCDIGGHYSRPDIFDLTINTKSARRIERVPG